jgi:hypothetical protein
MAINGKYMISAEELDRISNLPKEEVLQKAEELLKSPNVYTRIRIIVLVKVIPKNKRMGFLEKCLNDRSIDVRERAIRMFKYVPPEQIKYDLISKYLRLRGNGAAHWGLLEASIEAIQYMPKAEISALIHKAQGCPVFPSDVMSLVKHAPLEEQLPFVKKGLSSNNKKVKREALGTLSYMPPEDVIKIKPLITDSLELFIGHVFPDSLIVNAIKYSSQDKISDFIKKSYKLSFVMENNVLIDQLKLTIKYAPIEEQVELEKLVVNKRYTNIS